MRIYVVQGGYSWEGYDEPEAAFEDEIEARIFAENRGNSGDYHFVRVIPLTLKREKSDE